MTAVFSWSGELESAVREGGSRLTLLLVSNVNEPPDCALGVDGLTEPTLRLESDGTSIIEAKFASGPGQSFPPGQGSILVRLHEPPRQQSSGR